jgi:hypothetical protein
MINLKFGFNFEFNRDKSKDKLVDEHEKELTELRKEKEQWLTKKDSILENGLAGLLTRKPGVKA